MTSAETYLMVTNAVPLIVIGAVKAALQPFMPGFALTIRYWLTTCCLTVESQFSTDTFAGAANCEPRSANGSSIDGSVVKKSTEAVNFLISKIGGSGMSAGRSTEIITP